MARTSRVDASYRQPEIASNPLHRMPRHRFAHLIGCSIVAVACARPPVATQSSPTSEGTNGKVHEDVFFSDALGVRKHVMIYLPPSYSRDAGRRFPVAYYLHGLFGSETDWLAKGSIDVTADSLFASGAPEMILVMPDGDDGWYTTWADQVSYRTCADTLHVEAPGRYCVEHQRYDDYIARDVVRYIDGHYRTIADAAHRGIGGLSMGGYGAISLALHFPDVFTAAASHSGVVSTMYTGPHPFTAPARYASTIDEIRPTTGTFWPRYMHFWGTSLDRWRAADPAHSAERLVHGGARPPSLFIDCGSDDGLVDQNRALHSELTRLGIAHAYAEWPGAHTWRYWSTHVAESLAWMGGRIGR
jgi:S-formylglutathione hydrolase FrmB